MKVTYSNLWDIFDAESRAWAVCPTCPGFIQKTNDQGEQYQVNVMRHGMVKEAAKRHRWLPKEYAQHCMKRANVPMFTGDHVRLILLPTRPMNEQHPHLTYRNAPDFDLIRSGLVYLQEMVGGEWGHKHKIDDIYIPPIGCGNKGRHHLDLHRVQAMMAEILPEDFFHLVLPYSWRKG